MRMASPIRSQIVWIVFNFSGLNFFRFFEFLGTIDFQCAKHFYNGFLEQHIEDREIFLSKVFSDAQLKLQFN